MKLIDTIVNSRQMPAHKKKVLVIGAVAFIILLFVSFLLSLTEKDKDDVADAQQFQQNGQQEQQIPSSQRYDFDQANKGSSGLENLLNSAPQNANNQEYGVAKDPFAQMSPSREQGSHQNDQSQYGTGTGLAPSYGPAPIPTEEAPQGEILSAAPQTGPGPVWNLYCDQFQSASGAESQKAVLAFQGVTATVVAKGDGTFRLKLGPYADDATARATFQRLGKIGLIQQCSLLTE